MAGLPPYDWRETGHDDQFGLCDEWFLIHYGWRETLQTWKPEGSHIEFLIHYGWRESLPRSWSRWLRSGFLIHYGWRETIAIHRCAALITSFLIHYEWRETMARQHPRQAHHQVSNPLRVEGDCRVSVRIRAPGVVSNSLRVEGNNRPARGSCCSPGFLIHYGWRGTRGRPNTREDRHHRF